MFVTQRNCSIARARRMRGSLLATACAAAMLAGCSANITRLDAPSFALGEGAGGSSARRSAGGSAVENPAFGGADTASAPPPVRPRGATDVAGLSPIDDPASTANVPPIRAMAVTRQPVTSTAQPAIQPANQPVARGQQIEVQPGDTLYALSRRHNVMISDLMAANELRNPNLKPGQKLYLPATAGARALPAKVRPEPPVAGRMPASPIADAGDYTVKPGDSLFAIAARHKIKVGDLQRANGITDVSKVKPGTVLKIPSGAVQANAPVDPPAKAGPATPRAEPPVAAAPAPAPATPGVAGVKVLNGEGSRQAAVADPKTMSDAAAAPASSAAPALPPSPPSPANANAKLRWPVKGRVVQGYGPRADGTHNDGVDISVPAGADVLAAEGGVVAYAGNEVKTYGNLVLIRHDNGLVTAYAYNEKLLVQRGDRVKRGQPVAKAGKSGAADQPQLHFEVRVGSKPVDPVPYLEKL